MQHPLKNIIYKILLQKFNYTNRRNNLFQGLSGREISKKAMEFQKGIDD